MLSIYKEFNSMALHKANIKSFEAIDQLKFEEKFKMKLPIQLVNWLSFSNGSYLVNGVFGINNGEEALEIESYLGYYQLLIEKMWIPVSGDGCGNLYVLINDQKSDLFGTVCFFETARELDSISYIVASDFIHFILFLVNSEKGINGWPFNKDYVETLDLEISKYTQYLPWMNIIE